MNALKLLLCHRRNRIRKCGQRCSRRRSSTGRCWLRRSVHSARQPVDKVIRWPGPRYLHLALPHHGAGGGELVLVALNILAVNQVRYIEHHLAAFRQPAAYFLIQGHKQPMHLEAYRPCARLPFTGPRRVLAQVAEVLPANPFCWYMLVQRVSAEVIDENLQVHLRLAAKLVDIALELALVGTDGLAQAFVVGEYSAKTERENG